MTFSKPRSLDIIATCLLIALAGIIIYQLWELAIANAIDADMTGRTHFGKVIEGEFKVLPEVSVTDIPTGA